MPDGDYIVYLEAKDGIGNTGNRINYFSIRNWAIAQLLPSTAANKAGRTMPIKFLLNVKESVDPSQLFIYDEELTIRVFKKAPTSNVLMQTFVFGETSGDYRIDSGELYIANLKTLRTPETYMVEISRQTMLIASFEFRTTK